MYSEEQKTKAQQRSLSEPFCVSTYFINDTLDLSVTVVPLAKFQLYMKIRLLLLANTELILSANMMGNVVGIYRLPFRHCFLYWQDIAWHRIASGFAIIKIFLKASYLTLSALLGDRIDQHIWQKSPLQNCIVPKCQVQTWWQCFHLCIEL